MRILACPNCPICGTGEGRRSAELNAGFVRSQNSRRSPRAGHEYMLYQALIGAWPSTPIDQDFVHRIEEFAMKAAREGKLETSWLNPDEDYSRACAILSARSSDRKRAGPFLDSFEPFARRSGAHWGAEQPDAARAQGDDAGRAGFLSGNGNLGTVAGRSRQSPSGRFRISAAATLAANADADWAELASHWTDGQIRAQRSRSGCCRCGTTCRRCFAAGPMSRRGDGAGTSRSRPGIPSLRGARSGGGRPRSRGTWPDD